MADDSALQFLKTHKQAVLGTARKDGTPQLSNILTVYMDGAMAISTTESTAKYRNMRREPRVSLLVLSENFFHYGVVYGTAKFTHLPEALPMLREYYELASGGPHPDWTDYDRAMERDRRVLVSVSVDRVLMFPSS